MIADITWRVLVFSCPDRGLDPFAVWEAARGDVTAAGASPGQARERLSVAMAAEQEEP